MMVQGQFLRLLSVGLYVSLSLPITSQQLKDRAHAITELLRSAVCGEENGQALRAIGSGFGV
jgi:hypothetical protein